MKDNGLIEFRWHGRGGPGGQNGLPAPGGRRLQFGKFVQGFPEYGPERMGAPSPPTTASAMPAVPSTVTSTSPTTWWWWTRPCWTPWTSPGACPQGAVIVNTAKSPAEIRPKLSGWAGRVCTIDSRHGSP